MTTNEPVYGWCVCGENVERDDLPAHENCTPPPHDGPWLRLRFHADEDDYRPVTWPPPGPYWCSGYGDGYSTVVAWLPVGTEVTDYWPEASHVTEEEYDEVTFSDRFPCPDWWPESA